ncbi:TPA: zinc ribbon domain-containing protein [Burkholderia vietnamiensis]|uniref:Putative regulatory protein, FmdB family n=1 Tax=Burkholderia vietnamiensis (strain G4 / LMG 22486) TaxID=269482 RepID=A4JRN0_BURVG|nr:zinc ribbon domain-containing protein [Burkholderia vietnamiensis]ABO58933.1 putative regulatory protein, FmdB family [Burkholderia vietnamiensis G4]KVF12001.1 FmdB family transcriptional regulator [Burkholderia vietnamiensis]KVF96847.1 FmdB family transcriptional regulator [Burkholderia vietnamiensis]MBR7913536.1 zinc ribbon domain-containing protein [Burkholderia vietnamiensis]MBR8218723.1 zinc ribbon domain-containing protein [Burkholderia vietnamiensis]
MPLYDYRCRDCGRTFEALVRAGASPACPHCGSTALDRQVSAPAPPGRSREIVRNARRQAAHEGHLSNFSAAERAKLLK